MCGSDHSGNTAPTISNVADQATSEDVAKAGIAVTVADAETAAGLLTLTGTSSNPTLLPNAGIVCGGSGANRTVTLTPAANQNGTVVVTLTVSDGALTATDTFVLTVTAVNDPPTVAHAIPNQTATLGNAYSFAFAADTFADIDSGALTYSASGLPAGIVFTAATRSFSGTPTTIGTTTITVSANDGAGGTVTTTFDLGVTTAGGTQPPGISGGTGGGGCGTGGALGLLLVVGFALHLRRRVP